MTYGGYPYGGVGYAGADVAEIPDQTRTTLSVEVAFTTGALETPVWEDVTADVRSWSVSRGRRRELERYQPGRATVVLGNRSRQYDSTHTSGPHFGNLKPMRRIRIRETFNGVTYPVFDGYVDKWQLDYPNVGKDATATVTATDGFKILARTDLPRSVYSNVVDESAPVAWYRLGIPAYLTTELDLVGDRDLEHRFNPRPSDSLVTNDDNQSTLFIHPPDGSGNVVEGAVTTPVPTYPFSFEFVFRSTEENDTSDRRFIDIGGNESGGVAQRRISASLSTVDPGTISASITDDGGSTFSAARSAARYDDGAIHHVVVTWETADTPKIFVDGVQDSSVILTSTPALPSGTVQLAIGNNADNIGAAGEFGADASMQDVAFYEGVLTQADITAHYEASTHPWQDDLPGARIERILDIVDWPDELRELDTGLTTLQSAALNTTALEHLQKVTETEFGLLFMSKDGKPRFINRSGQFDRNVGPVDYGDGAGEAGYTAFVPDDGDDVIRNRALISRLSGAVRTANDAASITEFGRFDYTLDGLFHRTESYSQDYADFIVAEYAEPRRRVVALELGPPEDGEEDVIYPAMLGPELGDLITVTNTPLGGGGAFTQTCVVEGIEHQGAPGGQRTTRFMLSPEFTEASFS